MATRQAPLDNQVFRVQVEVEYHDGGKRVDHYGPYAKIGAAKGQLKHQMKQFSYYGRKPRSTEGKIEVIRGEWEEVES